MLLRGSLHRVPAPSPRLPELVAPGAAETAPAPSSLLHVKGGCSILKNVPELVTLIFNINTTNSLKIDL